MNEIDRTRYYKGHDPFIYHTNPYCHYVQRMTEPVAVEPGTPLPKTVRYHCFWCRRHPVENYVSVSGRSIEAAEREVGLR